MIQLFNDQTALAGQRTPEHDLNVDGWTGPHGWNL
jgi:hypothetical protein